MNLKDKFFCAFVGYFNGQMNRFYINEHNKLSFKPADSDYVPSVLIVSRAHYSENSKVYPIDSFSELRKLLALEHPNTDEKYFIGKPSDGKTNVQLWKYLKEVPKAPICLPESLLLATGIEVNSVIEVKSTNNIFISRTPQAVYSAESTALISSAKLFAMSVGIKYSDNTKTYLKEEHPSLLLNGISKLPFSYWQQLFNIESVIKNKKLGLKLFVPFSLIFCGYLLASSAFLKIQQSILENRLKEQSSQTNETLKLQQSFDVNYEKYTQLSDFFKTQKVMSPMWIVIDEIFDDTQIKNIREVKGRIVIRGTTPKAIELLEKVSKLPMVKNAKFDFPTRSQRGKDNFVIGFSLVDFEPKDMASRVIADKSIILVADEDAVNE